MGKTEKKEGIFDLEGAETITFVNIGDVNHKFEDFIEAISISKADLRKAIYEYDKKYTPKDIPRNEYQEALNNGTVKVIGKLIPLSDTN